MAANRAGFFVYAVILVGIVSSVYLAHYKEVSLSYHSRDFPYYMEFSSKLSDPNLTDRYSLNPFGHDFIGLTGTEGTSSFHKSIHFEPVKYLYALIYAMSATPLAIFLVVSLVAFLPLVYLVRHIPLETNADQLFLILFALLYAAWPSTLQAITYDLRPFNLLAPFFLLSLLSIYFQRPLRETLLFSNLMFVVREESLILGVILVLLAISSYGDIRERKAQVIGILSSWVFWVCITFIYFLWSGYATDQIARLSAAWAGLLLGGLTLTRLGWMKFKSITFSRSLAQLLAFGLVFVPLGFHFVKVHLPGMLESPVHGLRDAIFSLTIHPRYNLYFMTALLFCLFAWRIRRTNRFARQILSGMAFAAVAATILNAFWLINTTDMNDYIAGGQIQEQRRSLNKYEDHILTDYATFQGFYDFEHVYVFNRLPWYLIAGNERAYPNPANIQALTDLLANEIDYIVISRDSSPAISELLNVSSVESIRTVAENENFIILGLR